MDINKVDKKTSTHFYFWGTLYSQWFKRKDLFVDEGYLTVVPNST